MKAICPENQCTGCAACANICPQDSIRIVPDKYGYLYPTIDEDSCIDCHLCEKVCPNTISTEKREPIACYAGWSLDQSDRASSTSGGIASVFSTACIEQGGIVYGAINKGIETFHRRIDNKNQLPLLKGSKYVQSQITEQLFNSVKTDLKENREVLFIGTPCQIAGIKSYLTQSKNLSKITFCDIICHGVPSEQILQDHIKSIVPTGTVSKINFRDKDGYFLTIKSIDNKILYRKGFPKDSYLVGFQYGLFHRPSCYQCHYAAKQRISDVTIGDFWGLGETTYPKKKVSVIICNTEKGLQLIKSVPDKLFLDERSIDEAVQGNAQLQAPSKKHEFYNLFRKLYPQYGYSFSVAVCLTKFHVKHFVYKILYKIPIFATWYNQKRSNG